MSRNEAIEVSQNEPLTSLPWIFRTVGWRRTTRDPTRADPLGLIRDAMTEQKTV